MYSLTTASKSERDIMYYLENPKSHISKSLKLLKIHKRRYLGGVNGVILMDHFVSLKHGLQILTRFLEISENKDLIQRIGYSVAYVAQKLFSFTYLETDESLIMKLDNEYADLREEMKNVIISPVTNEYDVIFPEIFTRGYVFGDTSNFLCEKIKRLVTLECKIGKITPVMKELKDIRNMLISLLEPFYIYARDVDGPLTLKEEERNIFSTIRTVIDGAACLVYLSCVAKMDDEMVLSLKHGLSGLIIEETQIMKIYLSLGIDSVENLKSHIYMSLSILEWNRKFYLGTPMGATLEDHFMSIKHGLQFFDIFILGSRDNDLKLLIQHLVAIVKQKLYSLIHNPEDENSILNLEHAYGELREEMQNIATKPRTDDYDMLFPKIAKDWYSVCRTKDFLLEEISNLVASSCKADQITPIEKELNELSKKLTSMKRLFDYEMLVNKSDCRILDSLTTFLDRATCLIYLSFIGKLNEDMLVLVRKNLLFLVEETEIKEMSLDLEITWEDDFDVSLSLLKRQEENHIGTINEAILKDHVMSLTHGIEFLKWLPKVYFDRDLKRRIIVLAGDVKKKLKYVSYKEAGHSLNMDVNGAYADLREVMKNVIVNPTTNKSDTLFPEFSPRVCHLIGDNDFLFERIMTVVITNCEAPHIAYLKKELLDLQKMLVFLKPLGLFVDREILWFNDGDAIFTSLLTFHHKATFLIYLSFVGEMSIEMLLSVKSDMSTTVKEMDVCEMYFMILNKVLHFNSYLKEELYVLENLILLLKSNVESLNEANSKLYEVLIDIHAFLLGLSLNMILRKLHLLQAWFQAILGHSIPIVCSCYLEHNEVHISGELNCVVDLIKHIKSEAQDIKLYYFPKVDGLGFLEVFSEYLEDLMKNQETSMKEQIDALQFEVLSLLSLAKVTNKEELDETSWTDIINMAYQAEYVIDLLLVSSLRDLGLISSLSKIIEQLKNTRADVVGLCCRILPAKDVAVTSRPQVLGTTTQVSDNDAIVGLQEEAKIILEYLISGEHKLDVISIVGMAGVGKTTLALSLFKSSNPISHHFDILTWCTVSQCYQNRDLLLSILDQVNAFDKDHRGISDDQDLADHLCRRLKKRRFLIVLDDIWDTKLWNYLKSYLPDDMIGSRILITTRNQEIVDQIGSKVNQLSGLSEENSWELFKKKMLDKDSLSDGLLKISKGIIGHCKGLPLSIVIMAGILSDIERTEKKWNQMAESLNSIILSDPQGRCKALLRLSYNHLPNHLRSCFLYLGSFPEDQEISVNRLIILWIAEGLVRNTKSDSAEEVAKKYIEDLILKSLVIPAKKRSQGGVKTFRIHDLLRDFCLDTAKEKHFFTLSGKRNSSRPLQDPRRLIINGPHIDLHFSCHSIRSLICFHDLETFEIEKRVGSCDMLLLKVLEVCDVWFDSFPNISSLVHLRYLALGILGWEISGLPKSISKLQNLEIIILRCKSNVIRVPNSIWDMVKLRHVNISPGALFSVYSNRIGNSSFLLENLRSLSTVRVSWEDSEWLIKLAGLQKVQCALVYGDLGDGQFQMLRFNGHLTSLKLENAAGLKQRFVNICEYPVSLRELTLTKFLLASNDISEIVRALPFLEVFKLYSCNALSDYEWNVDDEDFPGLKVLKLTDLNISKWIVSENCFPNLEQLWLEKCSSLDEIPLDFGCLTQLSIISVKQCATSVDDSARKIEKLQHEDQNTEMKAHIYPRKRYPGTGFSIR